MDSSNRLIFDLTPEQHDQIERVIHDYEVNWTVDARVTSVMLECFEGQARAYLLQELAAADLEKRFFLFYESADGRLDSQVWLADQYQYLAVENDTTGKLLNELYRCEKELRIRHGLPLPSLQSDTQGTEDSKIETMSLLGSRSKESSSRVRPSSASISPATVDSINFDSPSGLILPIKLGEIELQEVIGRGGMGMVFRGYDSRLERDLAVKLIDLTKSEDPHWLKRFDREAKLASQLDHPGIVPVFSFRRVEGQAYYSMPMLSKGTLSDRIENDVISIDQAVIWAIDIADATGYAHQNDIVHRDLKPSNLLFDDRDRLRITDFGLARCVSDDEQLTGTAEVLGTAPYLDPNVVGKPVDDNPEFTIDIYSIGCILYEMLAGNPPFQGQTPWATIQKAIHDEPVPLRSLNSNIPQDLETICLKCLEKSPQRRYATCRDLAADLGRFQRGEPIQARRQNAVQRAAKKVRKKFKVYGPWVALAVMIALPIALALFIPMVEELIERRSNEKSKEERARAARAEIERQLASSDSQWRERALTAARAASELGSAQELSYEERRAVASTLIRGDVTPIAVIAEDYWLDAGMFSSDGSLFVAGQNKDPFAYEILLYDTADWEKPPRTIRVPCGAENLRQRMPPSEGKENGCRALAINHRNDRIAIGNRWGELLIYDCSVEPPRRVFRRQLHREFVQIDRLAFDAANRLWIRCDDSRCWLLNEEVDGHHISSLPKSHEIWASRGGGLIGAADTDEIRLVSVQESDGSRQEINWEKVWERDRRINNFHFTEPLGLVYNHSDGAGATRIDLDHLLPVSRSQSQNAQGHSFGGIDGFMPQSEILVTSERRRMVRGWATHASENVFSFRVNRVGGAPRIFISPTDSIFVTTSDDHATVWQYKTNQPTLPNLSFESSLLDMTQNERGDRLAVVGLAHINWNKTGSQYEYGFTDVAKHEVQISRTCQMKMLTPFTEPRVRFLNDEWVMASRYQESAIIMPADPTFSLTDSRPFWTETPESIRQEIAIRRDEESQNVTKLPVQLRPRENLEIQINESHFKEIKRRGFHLVATLKPAESEALASLRLEARNRKECWTEELRMGPQSKKYPTTVYLGYHSLTSNDSKVEISVAWPCPATIEIESIHLFVDKFSENRPKKPEDAEADWRFATNQTTGRLWSVLGDETLQAWQVDQMQPLEQWANRSTSHENGLGSIETLLPIDNDLIVGTIGGECFRFEQSDLHLGNAEPKQGVYWRESEILALCADADNESFWAGFDDGYVQRVSVDTMQVMEEFRASDEPIRSIKIDTRRDRILVAGDDGEIRFYRRGFNGAERLFAIDWGLDEVERMEYVAVRDHLAIIYAGETAIRTIDLDQLETQLIDLNVLPGHNENRRLTVATESP